MLFYIEQYFKSIIKKKEKIKVMLKNNRGFTLIELVMVIVLLGILAAIAVPRYVDLQQDARTAVVDASIGAIKSAAIIQYASTRTSNRLASIEAQTDLDAAINIVETACTTTGVVGNLTMTHAGGTLIGGIANRLFSIQPIFCSG